MPVYEYKCKNCKSGFEVTHSMKDNPEISCPLCGAPARKVITGGSGFVVKGASVNGTAIPCGGEKTCCGKKNPCETRPCGQ